MHRASQCSSAVREVLFYGWGAAALKNWLAQAHQHFVAELRKEPASSDSRSSTLSERTSFLSKQVCTCFPVTNRLSKWFRGLSWLEAINCDSKVNRELKFPLCWQWPLPLELFGSGKLPGMHCDFIVAQMKLETRSALGHGTGTSELQILYRCMSLFLL